MAAGLIRLQCYEGLDVSRGGLRVELRRADDRDPPRRGRAARSTASGSDERRVLRALPDQAAAAAGAGAAIRPAAPVLLIDELDRTDEAFEAFLLEVLADYQVTIPELGTVKAAQPPIVIITSNRTREIHDALKRRCLYHWVGYPNAERELKIVRAKVPGICQKLSERGRGVSCRRCASRTCSRRRASPRRSTGRRRWPSSTSVALDPATVSDTLGVLLKYQDDIAAHRRHEGRRNCSTPCRRSCGPRSDLDEFARSADPTDASPNNIVYFARALRAAGIPVGPGSVIGRARSGARPRASARARTSTGRCTPCS